MQSGRRRKPTINPISVEAALNTLVYTTTDTSSAATLLSLMIIEDYLHDPARPPASNLREYALKSLLCRLIESTLKQFRKTYGLQPPSITDTLSDAIEQIQRDSQQDSPELLGWSFLYYHFVRVDMGISHDAFGQHANIEARTLRRYKKYIISVLSDKLIDLEWQARRHHHKLRLLSAIPTDPSIQIIGYGEPLSAMLSAILDGKTKRCYITGVSGIGKTAFLSVLSGKLVSSGAFDYIVWVDEPQNIDKVFDAIREVVLPPHSQLDLRDMLHEYTTLIIMDDISHIAMQEKAYSKLLDFLAPCIVLMSSPKHLTINHQVSHLHLTELSRDDMQRFIEVINPTNHAEYIAEKMWQEQGGNPRVLQLALLEIETSNTTQLSSRSVSDLYSDIYDRCTSNQQNLWRLIASTSLHRVSAKIIDLCIEIGLFSKTDIDVLLQNFILQKHDEQDAFYIAKSAQKFIDHRELSLLDGWVQNILQKADTLAAGQVISEFCLQLLQKNTDIQAPLFNEMIRICWRLNHYPNDAHHWLKIFQTHKKRLRDSHSTRLAHGICLRQVNQSSAANQIFEDVVAGTGQGGDFETQAWALLELAILLRKQGNYQVAQNCLDRADSVAKRLHLTALENAIKQEFVQIHVERGNSQEAFHWLQQLHDDNFTVKILRAEVLLLAEQLEACRQLAHEILLELEATRDLVRLVSVNTIIARSYQQQKDYRNSIDYYNAALACSERLDDSFAIGRLKSNLASILIQLQDISEAQSLLQDAETIQKVIHDRIGLEATRHNLQYVRYIKSTTQ